MNRKYLFTILSVIVAIASITLIGIPTDNIDAKESVKKHYVTVDMPHVIEVKAGQTIDVPVKLINSNTERSSSVNLYVTAQDLEVYKNRPADAFTNDIDVSVSKASSTIAKSSAELEQTDSTTVRIVIPGDTAEGVYPYTLIVEKANDSLQYRKYFYVNVIG